MILVDSNLLIYAYSKNSPFQTKAGAWLNETLDGSASVGIPWHSIIAFLRVTTQGQSARPAITIPQSWAAVQSWLARPSVWIPQPTERHPQVFGSLLTQFAPRSRMVSDAHVAALAIEHNLTLCTADGDFARFPGLRWENPLQR